MALEILTLLSLAVMCFGYLKWTVRKTAQAPRETASLEPQKSTVRRVA